MEPTDNEPGEGATGKRLCLEDLSKEELIKKCKGILFLTQKAKQSKEEISNENVKLKRELNTTKEMVNSLLEQKMETAQKLDKYKVLNKKCTDLENKNESLERQITRLTTENNDLLNHLEKVENQIVNLTEIGIDQRNKLFKLLKRNDKPGDENVNFPTEHANVSQEELKTMLTISLEEIKAVRQDRDNLKAQIIEYEQQLCKFNDLASQLIEKDQNILKLTENLNALKVCSLEYQEKENHLKCEIEKLKYVTTTNQNNEVKNLQERLNFLNNELVISNEKNNQLQSFKDKFIENENHIENLKKEITMMKLENIPRKEFDEMVKINEKCKDKIILYRTKLKKLASALKELKETKQQLLETVKDCNTYIGTWKSEIMNVLKGIAEISDSTNISDNSNPHLSNIISQNKQLQAEKQTLQDEINNLNQKILEQSPSHDQLTIQKLTNANQLLQTGKLGLFKTISNLQKRVYANECQNETPQGKSIENAKQITGILSKLQNDSELEEIILNERNSKQINLTSNQFKNVIRDIIEIVSIVINVEDLKNLDTDNLNSIYNKLKLIEPVYMLFENRVRSLELYQNYWNMLVTKLQNLEQSETMDEITIDNEIVPSEISKVFGLITEIKSRLTNNRQLHDKEMLEKNINGLSNELKSLSDELGGYQKSEQEFNEKYDTLQKKFETIYDEKKMIETIYNERIQENEFFKQINENLKQEIVFDRETITKLKNQNHSLDEKSSSQYNEIRQLNVELENLKKAENDLQAKINSIEMELKSVNEQKTMMELILEKEKLQNSNLKEVLEKKQNIIKKLKDEKNFVQAEKSTINDLNDEIENLNQQLTREKDSNLKLKSKIDSFENELKLVREDKIKIESIFNEKRFEIDNLKQELEKKQNLIEKLKVEKNSLNTENQIKTTINEMNFEVVKLTQKLEIEKETNAGLNLKIDSIENELKSVREEKIKIECTFNEKAIENENLKQELVNKQNLLKRLKDEKDSLNTEKLTEENRIKTTIKNLNAEIEKLMQQINNEKETNAALQFNIDSIENELKSVREEKLKMESKIKEQTVETENLKQELEKEQNLIKRMKDEMDSVYIEKSSQENQMKMTLNNLNVEIEKLIQQIKDEQETNTMYKSKIDSIQTDLKLMQEEKLKIASEKDNFKQKFEKQKNLIKKLKDENNAIHTEKLCQESQIKAVINDLNIEIEKLNQQLNHEKTENSGLKTKIESIEANKTSVDSTIQKLTIENENLTQKLAANAKINETLTTEKKLIDSKYNELNFNYEELIQKLSNEKEINKSLNERINLIDEELQKVNEKATADKDHAIEETESLKSEIDSLTKELTLIKDQNSKLNENVLSQKSQNETQLLEIQEKYSENCEIINELNQKLELQNYIENEIDVLKKENAELKNILEKEHGNMDEIKSQKIIIDELKKSNKQFMEDINRLLKENEELSTQMGVLKSENTEIIKEMHEMVEELKVRGENLSKSQNSQLESQLKLEKLNIEHDKCLKELSKKDKIIHELQEELEKIKDKLLDDSLSTSTISRTEDVNRFAEIEGTWEERYNKLKNLAIKLKKKITFLNDELQSLGTKKSNLEEIVAEQNLEIENLKKELKESGNEKLTTLNLQSNPDLQKLSQEIETLNKDKQSTKNIIKEFKNEIKMLKKDHENDLTQIKELENKLHNCELELKNKDKQLQDEIIKHKTTKDQLIKSNKECKKKSVLSLEMEDYERSLKELSQKLKDKQQQITDLEKTIDTHSDTINTLREQIRSLDDALTVEKNEIEQLKVQLNENRAKVKESEEMCIEKDKRIRNLENMLEKEKHALEEVNVQLSKVIGENQKFIVNHKNERDQLRSIILSREEKIREITENLELTQQEMTRLHEEFDKYKIRATNILRQNKEISSPSYDFQRLSEESIELKMQIETLKNQNSVLSNQIKSHGLENEKLLEEKLEAEKKYEELLSMLQTLKKEHDELIETHMKQSSDHNEALRVQKIRNETLSQCYKQQITELEEKHVKEIREIQKQLHKKSSDLSSHKSTSQLINKPPTYLATKSSITEDVDINFMKREDAEGSESFDSTSFGSQPIPLDQLLSTNTQITSMPHSEIIRPQSPGTELRICKEKLNQHKAQVAHLTGLLSDTEKDVAKLSQLNEILKEEIRRHQRSVEREQHAENLEYMKNVIFKFITSGNADEKSHLIPVLNTILKLSPDETQKLNAVAKGIDPATGRPAWSAYLPLPKWPGT